MSCLTINMLFKELKRRIEKGEGDYVIFVTDDEEGNGYHALWYNGQTPAEMLKKGNDLDLEYFEEINHDLDVFEDKSKALYLG